MSRFLCPAAQAVRGHGHARASATFARTFTSSTQPQSRRAVNRPWLVSAAGLAAGLFGLYHCRPQKSPGLPLLRDDSIRRPAEADADIDSPVKPLSLQEANLKLRRHAHTNQVPSADGGILYRVDRAQLASNSPVEDYMSTSTGPPILGDDYDTFCAGVYDGHAGWATAKLLSQTLTPHVMSALRGLDPTCADATVALAIKKAFVEVDDGILGLARSVMDKNGPEAGSPEAVTLTAPATAGSCALLSLYSPSQSKLRVACTGDSRAVLGSWSSKTKTYTAEALSKDQTGFNEDELKRVHAAHPGEEDDVIDVKSGRLLGIAVTRAFGDHRWKMTKDEINRLKGVAWGPAPRPKAKSPPYMTAEPEVTTTTVQSQDFAILASDGLWDVMSNEAAVDCVSRWLSARRSKTHQISEEQKRNHPTDLTIDEDGDPHHKADPKYFVIEDLDNAAVCLMKNALGGSRRQLFRGLLTVDAPQSRNVRDDISVQVVFFGQVD